MTAQPVFQSPGRPRRDFTWEDLQTVPDDGYRYELLDGVLLVSPAPGTRHVVAVAAVYDLLRAARPEGLFVGVAPYDFTDRESTCVQPDVFVVRREAMGEQRTTTPPLLAVEVVSPESRRIDGASKRLAYEEFAVASYWIVDPEARSVEVLELEQGAYVQRALLRGSAEVELTQPFPVRLSLTVLDG